MTKTKNYNLNQWEPADPIRRTDFNADNAAIDAALAGNARALSDYKTANDAAVAKKADKTALAALEQSVQTLSSALGSGGRTARIAWGSYAGSGSYGSTNACTLTFEFQPTAVLIGSGKGDVPAAVLLRGSPKAGTLTVASGLTVPAALNLTWGEKSVSWYSATSAAAQCNAAGTYYYVAVGA